ncbi:MAG: lysophospholipid acyltransferase family protein [Defluviicoccus sp.]|nr:lysophospholipid acyltransferase family protein [Defluviicoccus sp.]
MIGLRSLAFQTAFYVWTLGLGLLTLPVLLLPRAAVLGVAKLWIDGTFWLLSTTVGLTYEVRGPAHRAKGPAIYAIKHQSAWDTLVLMRLFREPAIVMKGELAWMPFVGWYLVRLGMIPIDRRAGAAALRRMVRTARECLAAGRDIVVFPEGTRTAPGQRLPYRPGIAALYAALDVPVVPVALNSGLYWARREFAKRPGRIVVSMLPAIAPGLERKPFMDRLRDRIESETARLNEEARGDGDRKGAR